MILLHGFLESHEIWEGLSEELSRSFRVLMIDLPGHGRSGSVDEVHSMELMRDCVLSVADHLGIRTFGLCGHSMGGYVSLALAETVPERVSALVLFHSHAAPDDETIKENRRRTINIVKLNRPNFIHHFIIDLFAEENRARLAGEIEVLRNRAAATPGKSIVAALRGMMDRAGSLDFLMSTRLPILFIIGKADSRMPYNKVMAQAMLPACSEILLLGDAGHMGFLEAPGVTIPVIRDFLKRNVAGG